LFYSIIVSPDNVKYEARAESGSSLH